METESGRSSIRGNIYFAAGIYTDEYIIQLLGSCGNFWFKSVDSQRYMFSRLCKKCDLMFYSLPFPIWMWLWNKNIMWILKRLRKLFFFLHLCSVRISQRKHPGSHFQILQKHLFDVKVENGLHTCDEEVLGKITALIVKSNQIQHWGVTHDFKMTLSWKLLKEANTDTQNQFD